MVTNETTEYCTRCGEYLKTNRIVWLHLHTGHGYSKKLRCEEGSELDQGLHPFGSACAKAAITEYRE